MILSFVDKETEKIFNGEFSKKLPIDIQSRALRKLMTIDQSQSIECLFEPTSNHLEKLQGEENRWSIRINKQWRICFTPINSGQDYIDVEIVDYH